MNANKHNCNKTGKTEYITKALLRVKEIKAQGSFFFIFVTVWM